MPTPTDPVPVRRVGRFALDPTDRDHLWKRQAGWVAGLVVASIVAVQTGVAFTLPELLMGCFGLAAVAAFPRKAPKVVAATAAMVGLSLALGPVTPGHSTLSSWLDVAAASGPVDLHATQYLAPAFLLGAALPHIDDGPADTFRSLNTGFVMATTVGVGVWAGFELVPTTWVTWAYTLCTGAILGLVSAQSLLVLALRYKTTDRIPTREVIADTLDETHRGPALVAWQLDHDLDELCPDADSRDGLGEVATWVYRLQWTRQHLASEVDKVGGPAVEERIVDLTERAEQAEDDFTRDRLMATVQHLQRLQGHREALTAEQARAAALSEFATAFLQEARAELTLARVQPGDASPDRLPEVLDRLRTYSADRALARQTRREVAAIAG